MKLRIHETPRDIQEIVSKNVPAFKYTFGKSSNRFIVNSNRGKT
jgi:hypothetical protein